MSELFDREKARGWLTAHFGVPNFPDKIDDFELDALEACVRPDPRIAALWALSVEMIDENDTSWIRVKSLVEILRGEGL